MCGGRLAFNAMPAALTADMWTHVCVCEGECVCGLVGGIVCKIHVQHLGDDRQCHQFRCSTQSYLVVKVVVSLLLVATDGKIATAL